jgi:hypothetical protein
LTLFEQESGKARAGLGVAANGSPALALFDKNGEDRAELHISSSGKGSLNLLDQNGKPLTAPAAAPQ